MLKDLSIPFVLNLVVTLCRIFEYTLAIVLGLLLDYYYLLYYKTLRNITLMLRPIFTMTSLEHYHSTESHRKLHNF